MPAELPVLQAEIISSGTALEAVTRGEVDIQIATARHYPRSMALVRKKVLELATQDRTVAERCWYVLPREGRTIDGPSVRLAEIVASSYGNLRCAARVSGTDDKHVTVQGVAWDLENNVAISIEVKRRITDRNGRRYSDDMIAVTSNAACAIAFRNAVFKVVPTALLESVKEEIRKVGLGDERTLAERRKAVLVAFEALGVLPKRLYGFLGCKGQEDITLEQLDLLRGIYVAIRDAETTVEEAFGPVQAAPVVGGIPAEAIKPQGGAEPAADSVASPSPAVPPEPQAPAPSAGTPDHNGDRRVPDQPGAGASPKKTTSPAKGKARAAPDGPANASAATTGAAGDSLPSSPPDAGEAAPSALTHDELLAQAERLLEDVRDLGVNEAAELREWGGTAEAVAAALLGQHMGEDPETKETFPLALGSDAQLTAFAADAVDMLAQARGI